LSDGTQKAVSRMPSGLEQPGAEELAEVHARELFDEITQRADCDK
jgi:hypothetical protein